MKIVFQNNSKASEFCGKLQELLVSGNKTIEILGEDFSVEGLSTGQTCYDYAEIQVNLMHSPKREFPKNHVPVYSLLEKCIETKDVEKFAEVVLEKFVSSGKLAEYLQTHDAQGYLK